MAQPLPLPLLLPLLLLLLLPQVLEREMRTDETLYDAILQGAVPTVDTIYRFMTYLKVHHYGPIQATI